MEVCKARSKCVLKGGTSAQFFHIWFSFFGKQWDNEHSNQVLYMIRYLGKRHGALMRCIDHGATFTAHELGVHPQTMKGLANDGLLEIVEKRRTYPARPYTYHVPEKVRQYFSDE